MSLMATGPRCWQWQRGKDDVLAEGAGINNTAVVMRTDLCFNAAKRHGGRSDRAAQIIKQLPYRAQYSAPLLFLQ